MGLFIFQVRYINCCCNIILFQQLSHYHFELLIAKLMNIRTIVLLASLLLQSVFTLEYRQQSHQLQAYNNHQYISAYEIFSDFFLIGIIAVMLLVGGCCFYFRGFFSGGERRENNVVVVQSSNRQPSPVSNRHQIEEVEQSARQQTNKNAILQYYSSQKAPPVSYQQPERIKESNSPYVTIKQDKFSKWDTLKTSASITACGICNIFNKSNAAPIVQIECMQDHCFHVNCISEHRSRQVVENAGNGLNKCPKCKQNYSPVAKIYCPICKNRAIQINLVNYSNKESGLINTDQIVGKYGFSCQDCRN